MMALAKRDPEFKAGLSAALRDHLQGMTDPKFIQWMEKPSNAGFVRDLLGDRMLAQWKRLAADAKRDQLRRTRLQARIQGVILQQVKRCGLYQAMSPEWEFCGPLPVAWWIAR